MSKEIQRNKITDTFGRLIDVYAIKYTYDDSPDMTAAIQFVFENGVVYNEALPETDEMSIRDGLLLDDYSITEEVSSVSPWKELLGSKAIWVWQMKNQQGYSDGVQYSFYNEKREERLIQMVVAASEVFVFKVQNLLLQK